MEATSAYLPAITEIANAFQWPLHLNRVLLYHIGDLLLYLLQLD